MDHQRTTFNIHMAWLKFYNILALIIPILTLTFCHSQEELKFDRDVWLENNNDKANNPRNKMVNDLISNELQRGMSNEQIEQLLG